MKRTTLFNLFILAFILLFGVTACKKNPKGATPIPGSRNNITGNGPGGIVDNGAISIPNTDPSTGSIEAADPSSLAGRTQDRDKFAANTVHFDLDSSTVKSSEGSKIEAVANEFKSGAVGDLLIEGHCDERGTVEYNLALGQRRAESALRYLGDLGISRDRLTAVSFGEERPFEVGHDESSWSQNRRAHFVIANN